MTAGLWLSGGAQAKVTTLGTLPKETEIAQDLMPQLYGQSPETGIARAGWMVSAYAAGVVVGARAAPATALSAARRAGPRW